MSTIENEGSQMTVVPRGSCNKCGQCCGQDNLIPAFPWSPLRICHQYDPVINPLRLNLALVELYNLVKHLIDGQGEVNAGEESFVAMVLTGENYGRHRGLVRSETETYCPFLDYEGTPDLNAPGGIAHNCLARGGAEWQMELCQGMPCWTTKLGQQIEGIDVEEAKQFLRRHPKCGFWLEER